MRSYLQAFSPKILREARRIMSKGFTAEDIDKFLGDSESTVIIKSTKRLRQLPEDARKQALAQAKFGKKKP